MCCISYWFADLVCQGINTFEVKNIDLSFLFYWCQAIWYRISHQFFLLFQDMFLKLIFFHQWLILDIIILSIQAVFFYEVNTWFCEFIYQFIFFDNLDISTMLLLLVSHWSVVIKDTDRRVVSWGTLRPEIWFVLWNCHLPCIRKNGKNII